MWLKTGVEYLSGWHMGKETKVGVCEIQVPLEHCDGLAKFGWTSETTYRLIAAASMGFLSKA